jgi:hypothetical protein
MSRNSVGRLRRAMARGGPERASVVFTRPTVDIARFDIAVGPCVRPPRKKRRSLAP